MKITKTTHKSLLIEFQIWVWINHLDCRFKVKESQYIPQPGTERVESDFITMDGFGYSFNDTFANIDSI